MNIYISGISGTGLGPLALMALDAGIHVTGSDRAEGAITGELRRNGIDCCFWPEGWVSDVPSVMNSRPIWSINSDLR